MEDLSNEQVLDKWDDDELVWTIELGGMGPGYEQCIQIMVFEMLRAMMDAPPADWSALEADDGILWRRYCDQIDASIKPILGALSPSGAQHGAAISTAARFARDGYSAAMATVPDDRRIMVCKRFPQWEV